MQVNLGTEIHTQRETHKITHIFTYRKIIRAPRILLIEQMKALVNFDSGISESFAFENALKQGYLNARNDFAIY